MGRELHAWLQPGHLVFSRQTGCETHQPDMPSGWRILGVAIDGVCAPSVVFNSSKQEPRLGGHEVILNRLG
jgi:hypothetical protein